jgi:hypothetical protein
MGRMVILILFSIISTNCLAAPDSKDHNLPNQLSMTSANGGNNITPPIVISHEIIGYSVEEWSIELYIFSPDRKKEGLLLIGGIHGKYEVAAVDFMNTMVDYFKEFPPEMSVGIIPNINPDSFYSNTNLNDDNLDGYRDGEKVGRAWERFNARYVDLNRNWETPSWKSNISYNAGDYRIGAGGEYPFSEPEIRAVRDLILNSEKQPWGLVILYHSYVYTQTDRGTAQPSYSGDWDEPKIDEIAAEYAQVYAGSIGFYDYLPFWNKYEVPGEFLNWCGINGIHAVEIEFSSLAQEALDYREHSTKQVEYNIQAVLKIIEIMSE